MFVGQVYALAPAALDRVIAAVRSEQKSVVCDAHPALTYEADGVAVVSVRGILVKRPYAAQWLREKGFAAMTYTAVCKAMMTAALNPQVKSVRLVIDSAGGEFTGVHEAADAIFSMTKPVTAFVETEATSAAYWLASQARGGIEVARGAQVGGIGVYYPLVDSSQALARQGVKVHIVASSAIKGGGHPGAPVTQAHLADTCRLVMNAHNSFVDDVARARPKFRAKEATDGRAYGAAEALALGLIDRTQAPVVLKPSPRQSPLPALAPAAKITPPPVKIAAPTVKPKNEKTADEVEAMAGIDRARFFASGGKIVGG